jgi:glucosamine-6-phosphate deaminase
MRVIIEHDYDTVSYRAADFVTELLQRKPDAVLGLATGSTPIGLYQELIRRHKNEGLDFSKATTFNLDEYYGLLPNHPQSYNHFMRENFFKHINIPDSHINIPSGTAKNVEAWCASYERRIKEVGGVDLQILGIGSDGHIAFNEPGSSLGSRTRIKTLTAETIEDNSRFFEGDEDVPRFAITMGVGTILEARTCLIMASGTKKAHVWAQLIEGPVTAQVTASALQLHPDIIAVCDEVCASELDRRKYYEHIEVMSKDLARILGIQHV